MCDILVVAEQCGYTEIPTGHWLKRKMGQRLDDSISKWLDDKVPEKEGRT